MEIRNDKNRMTSTDQGIGLYCNYLHQKLDDERIPHNDKGICLQN